MVEEPEAPQDPVPPIEPMDRVITREVWSEPRQEDPIQMDSERAQQVSTFMIFVVRINIIPCRLLRNSRGLHRD